GTGSFNFLWNTGGNTQSINGLSPGNYDVTVVDGNGCSASTSVSVGEIPPTQVSFTVSQISCNGAADGEIIAQITNGIPPYQVTWSNGATGEAATSLTSGNYGITVTDSIGCVFNSSVTLTEPQPII